MNFLSGLVIGFVIGWLVIKRPQWVTDLFAWFKQKIGW